VRRLVVALAAAAAVLPAPAGADDNLSLRVSVTPRTHLFGDPVVAEVQAVTSSAAAARMRVKTDFAPYVVVGPMEVERIPAGDQTQVRWLWHLECLTRACLPGATQHRVLFEPVKVVFPIAGRDQVVTAIWPTVIVKSRLGPDDRARPEQRVTIYPLGGTSSRVDPATLERLLWVVAGFLVLAALALVLPFARRMTRFRYGFDRLGPAERALVLARRALARDDPGRRRTALERLGRELARYGAPDLADEASRLAWAESPPAGDAMTGLVGRAEQVLKGAH
jgi:hypothetical protein